MTNLLHPQKLSFSYKVPGEKKKISKPIKCIKDTSRSFGQGGFVKSSLTYSQTLLKHYSLGPQSSAAPCPHQGCHVCVFRVQPEPTDTVQGYYVTCKAEQAFHRFPQHKPAFAAVAFGSLLFDSRIPPSHFVTCCTELTSIKQPTLPPKHKTVRGARIVCNRLSASISFLPSVPACPS